MEFNVMDYGAKGDGVTDDRVAIQAAVDAAHAAGGGVVVFPAGTFIVSGQSNQSLGCVMLYSNITVVGAGMGQTNVKLQDGFNGAITGIFRDPFGVGSSNITVRDITIDGNRAHTTGKIDGWFSGTAPGSTVQDHNITLDHVEVKNCGGYGFDPHEQTVGLTITNCVSHGNGLDGFTLDFQIGATIENNTAYGNDRHGFNIVTSTHDIELTDNVAYGNGSAGIMVQRGSTDIPVPTNVQITGGSLYNNGLDGIQINKADNVTVDDVDIYGNGQRGVRIMGSAGSIIENSTIHDNSQSKSGGYQEISIESYNDTAGASGRWYYTTHTQILNNVIYDTGAIKASYGIRELADGSDYTVISGNTISGTSHNTPLLNGPHSVNQPPDMTFTFGTDAADTIHGIDNGASTITGFLGNDSLYGGSRNDIIAGGQGNDLLSGGAGNDTLLIDSGNDNLTGGTGRDLFKFDGAFTSELGASNATITDFQAGTGGDVLDLSELLHTVGYTGANATGDGYITFTQSGANTLVMFDRDGAAGPSAPVLLATLAQTTASALTGDNLVTTAQSILYAAIAGQSNALNMSRPSPDGGSGVGHLQADLIAGAGFAQVFTLGRDSSNNYINLAVSGSTVNGDNPNVTDPARVWWYPGSATPGQALLNAVNLIAQQIATLRAQGVVTPTIIWGQGDAEASTIGAISDPTARAAAVQAYINNTRAVFDYIKAHVGGDLQFYILETGRFNVAGGQAYGMTDSQINKYLTGYAALHGAQEAMALTYGDVHLAANYTDLPMRADVSAAVDPEANPSDYMYLSGASREIVGDRLADFIALDLGQKHVIDNPGPYPLNVLPDLTIHAGAGLAVDGNAQSNIIAGTTGNDTLRGLDGNDALVGGAGNDRFEGGAGADAVFGGTGADTFVFDHDTALGAVDTLADFNLGQGDVINLISLLTAFNSHTDDPANFVRVTLDGNGNSVLSVDIDGSGTAYGFTPIAVLSGVTGLPSLHDLIASGALLLSPPNQPPVAQPDSVSANWGSGISGNVLLDNGHGADTDPDLDPLTVDVPVATTADGFAFSIAADGSFSYAPPVWFAGQDSFQYRVTDTAGNTAMATVSLTITAPAGSVIGTLGSETLNGTAASEYLFGNSGQDLINGAGGNDTLIGGAGAQTLAGGTGDDSYIVDDAADLVVEASGEGVDTVLTNLGYSLTGNVDNLTLTGTAAVNAVGNALDNVLIANTANNLVDGGDGNDSLTGGQGDDDLYGGAGNDVYSFSQASGHDTITNAGGLDSIVFDASVASAGVTYLHSPAPGSLDLIITYGAGDSITVRNFFDASQPGQLSQVRFFDGTTNDFAYINSVAHILTGGAGNDSLSAFDNGNTTLNGLDGNDSLVGAGGNDALNGGTGNDALDGGPGSDTLTGGTGDDSYYVGATTDLIVEQAGEGTDTVYAAVSFTLAANVENIVLTGSVAATATGNSAANLLDGSQDTAANSLVGGAGDDTYILGAGDTITETSTGGTDLVITAASYVLASSLENLTLTGSAAVTGTGNSLANQLTGNSGDNFLDGKTGQDTLAGGTGNDTYQVDDSGDLIIEAAAEGTDTVIATTSYSLAANIENLTLSGSTAKTGTGNALDNTITGNSGADTLYGADGNDSLNGGSGSDLMFGGTGNDTYNVDHTTDIVTENAGEGIDTIVTTTSLTLVANVENLILTASGAKGTGNSDNNQITAGDGDNVLDYGGAGNDQLNGASGSDVMYGGAGNDTYFVDKSTDIVSENAGEGTDTVYSTISYTLAANVENLVLTGTSAINATGGAGDDNLLGNTANNTLTGNSGNDTLDGGGGTDMLRGGAGNDLYNYTSGLVTIDEQSLGGSDTLMIGGGVTINDISTAVSVKNLIITINAGTDQITIVNQAASTPTSHIETIAFSDGFSTTFEDFALWQRGGTGNDSLTGGATHDTLIAGSGNDSLNGLAGDDAIHGGVGNDTIIGGDGNDLLFGGAGNDAIYGQAGLDTLMGGSGADTFMLDSTAYAGVDLLKDFTTTEGDSIDLTGLLPGYVPGTSLLSDYVHIVNDGFGNSLVMVDSDGAGSGATFQAVLLISGHESLDAAGLVASGNLFV